MCLAGLLTVRESREAALYVSPYAGSQSEAFQTPARKLSARTSGAGALDPGSGAFGAALAAARRDAVTPSRGLSRSFSMVWHPSTCFA